MIAGQNDDSAVVIDSERVTHCNSARDVVAVISAPALRCPRHGQSGFPDREHVQSAECVSAVGQIVERPRNRRIRLKRRDRASIQLLK